MAIGRAPRARTALEEEDEQCGAAERKQQEPQKAMERRGHPVLGSSGACALQRLGSCARAHAPLGASTSQCTVAKVATFALIDVVVSVFVSTAGSAAASRQGSCVQRRAFLLYVCKQCLAVATWFHEVVAVVSKRVVQTGVCISLARRDSHT